MADPLQAIASAWLAAGLTALVVELAAVQGSAPRAAGTRLLVAADSVAGTLGGGQLEWLAISRARQWLHAGGQARPPDRPERIALGPSLGQCCGGVVWLRWLPLDAAVLAAWPRHAPRFTLMLYGAGHVGRAVARLLADLPCRLFWLDERDDAFAAASPFASWAPLAPLAPDAAAAASDAAAAAGSDSGCAIDAHPDAVHTDGYAAADGAPGTPGAPGAPGATGALAVPGATGEKGCSGIWRADGGAPTAAEIWRQAGADAVAAAQGAAPGACHLVLTHSHDLDFRLVHAILQRGDAAWLGLIGSASKRARFVQRLARRGLAAEALAPLVCPIGLPGLQGKEPAVVALSVVAQLLLRFPATAWPAVPAAATGAGQGPPQTG